jgi:hypothetical protein
MDVKRTILYKSLLLFVQREACFFAFLKAETLIKSTSSGILFFLSLFLFSSAQALDCKETDFKAEGVLLLSDTLPLNKTEKADKKDPSEKKAPADQKTPTDQKTPAEKTGSLEKKELPEQVVKSVGNLEQKQNEKGIKSVPKVRKQAVPVAVPGNLPVKPIKVVKPKVIRRVGGLL